MIDSPHLCIFNYYCIAVTGNWQGDYESMETLKDFLITVLLRYPHKDTGKEQYDEISHHEGNKSL